MRQITTALLVILSTFSAIGQSSEFIDFFYRQTTYGETEMSTLKEHHRIIFNNIRAIVYDIPHTRISDPFYFKQSLDTDEFTWYYYEDDRGNALMIEVYGRFAVFMEKYDVDKRDWTIVTLFTKTPKINE